VHFIAIRLQYAHNHCRLRGTSPSTSLRKGFASRPLSNSTAESGFSNLLGQEEALTHGTLQWLHAQGNKQLPRSDARHAAWSLDIAGRTLMRWGKVAIDLSSGKSLQLRAHCSNLGLIRFSNEKISSHFCWLRSFFSLTMMSWRLLPVSYPSRASSAHCL
jgi:hypothetical protein